MSVAELFEARHELNANTIAAMRESEFAQDLNGLAAVDVQVERHTRAEWIRGHLEQAAREAAARADLPQGLFDELVDLVESPQLIEGGRRRRGSQTG